MTPTADEIDARIDAWHAGAWPGPLHEALGWTEAEYAKWMADPMAVPERMLPALGTGGLVAAKEVVG